MERYDLLREWMNDNSVTLAWAGKKMGMTGQGVGRLLRAARIPVKRHEALVLLGFPIELLPRAENYVRKAIVPVWEQASRAGA